MLRNPVSHREAAARRSGLPHFAIAALLLLPLLLLSACSTTFPNLKAYDPALETQRYNAALQKARATQDLEKPAVEPLVYRVRPTDVIEVAVFDYDKMNVATRVGVDGTINFPPLGEVRVAGMTQREIENAIAASLRGSYLQNPSIIVSIKEAMSQNITILGEVKTPGQQAVWGTVRLVDALAKAGGVNPTASNIAYLVRDGGARATAPAPGILTETPAAPKSPDVASGLADMVSGSPGGAPGLPGAAAVLPVMMLETSAVPTAAGSLLPLAPAGDGAIPVSLTGLLEKGEKEWNIPLQPGDVITIPPAGSVHATGPGIAKPGTYPLSFEGKTIREVIDEAGGLKWGAKRDIVLARTDDQGKTQYYKVDYKKTLEEDGYDGALRNGDRLIVQTSGWRQTLDAFRRGFLSATGSYSPTPGANIGVGTNALLVR